MSEEGFLSRWSRRKRAIEAGRPVAEPEVAATPDALPPAPPPVPEEPPFDITTLPPIDSLTAASDFTAFLRKEVPAALRGAALRRAWSLDPAIRDFVGPADYAWDYNAPDGVPGGSLDLVGDVREMLAQVFGPEPAAEGDVQGKVAGVAPEGARDEGAPEGARDEGAPEGARDEGAPECAGRRAGRRCAGRRAGRRCAGRRLGESGTPGRWPGNGGAGHGAGQRGGGGFAACRPAGRCDHAAAAPSRRGARARIRARCDARRAAFPPSRKRLAKLRVILNNSQ